jgi:thiol-disulfide isomerase/thioredoxin
MCLCVYVDRPRSLIATHADTNIAPLSLSHTLSIYLSIYATMTYSDAPFCGPCVQLAPVWAALAADVQLASRDFRFATVDGSLSPGLAARFQVRGYPALR